MDFVVRVEDLDAEGHLVATRKERCDDARARTYSEFVLCTTEFVDASSTNDSWLWS